MLRRMNTKANWPWPCREHWKQQGNKAMAFRGQRSGLRSTPTRLSRNVRGSTDCLTIHMCQTCFTSVEATGLPKESSEASASNLGYRKLGISHGRKLERQVHSSSTWADGAKSPGPGK